MTWIGLRDSAGAHWHPRGLGAVEDAPDPGLMPRGAIFAEFTVVTGPVRRSMLRQAARDPWESLFNLCLDPDGSIVILQGWQGDSRTWRLPVPRLSEGETVIVSLQWDGPARTGMVSAWLPDRPQLVIAAAAPPLPLHGMDARRMVTDPRACPMAPEVAFLAVSDRPVPVGPLDGVNDAAPVRVPGGWLAASALAAGDAVTLASGGLARIIWAGAVQVPARGRFRPFHLRAPYHGLSHDILASADLRITLRGTDIEYLFGTEAVAVAARQLTDQKRVIEPLPALTVRYRQFLIDRPGALVIGGAEVEPFDLSALNHDPRLVAVAGPGRIALPAVPPAPAGDCPHLRDYEALTLRRMRAA